MNYMNLTINCTKFQTMKKLLIFHPALAPYRIDQFNDLSKIFDLEVVFIFNNVWNHKFDQRNLTSQLEFKFSYLLTGICFKGRVFRFGILKKITNKSTFFLLKKYLCEYLIAICSNFSGYFLNLSGFCKIGETIICCCLTLNVF